MTSPVVTSTRGQAFCTKCGRPARIEHASLDPRHPVIACSRYNNEGEDEGCGRQVGTFDQAESDALVRHRRRERATAAHQLHIAHKRPSADCDICAVNPPATRAKDHPYELIERKYRVAAHLEFGHADRVMLARLPLRSAGELIHHHRKLHGLADNL